MNKKALEDYAEAIQNYYGQKRGASLILSPNDFLKIEEWFKKGIPLRAVKKGIDRHFEKVDPSRRLRAVVLRFAEGSIIDEWEIMKAGGANESGRRQSPEDEAAERKRKLAAYIHRCRKMRAGAELGAGALFDQLIAKAIVWKDSGSTLSIGEMAETLDNYSDKYIHEVFSPERLATAHRTAERDLAPFRDRMNPETYKEVLETNTLEALRIELGVPRLMEL